MMMIFLSTLGGEQQVPTDDVFLHVQKSIKTSQLNYSYLVY